MKKLAYLLRDIDPELWARAKILAIKRGTTVRQLLFDLLNFAVQKVK